MTVLAPIAAQAPTTRKTDEEIQAALLPLWQCMAEEMAAIYEKHLRDGTLEEFTARVLAHAAQMAQPSDKRKAGTSAKAPASRQS